MRPNKAMEQAQKTRGSSLSRWADKRKIDVKTVEKSFAYITNGDRLLVFEHSDFPVAGAQVPAGTILPGEPPEVAVIREAREETGLDAFPAGAFVGISEFDAPPFGKVETHR